MTTQDIKAIKPVDRTAKTAAISKYSPNREGGDRGRRQKPLNSNKATLDAEEAVGFEHISQARPQETGEHPDFSAMLLKAQANNMKRTEQAQTATPKRVNVQMTGTFDVQFEQTVNPIPATETGVEVMVAGMLGVAWGMGMNGYPRINRIKK